MRRWVVDLLIHKLRELLGDLGRLVVLGGLTSMLCWGEALIHETLRGSKSSCILSEVLWGRRGWDECRLGVGFRRWSLRGERSLGALGAEHAVILRNLVFGCL